MADPDCWHYLPLALRVFYPLKSSESVICSNSHGFRTHEFDFPQQSENAKYKVIVVLGGSGSWGLGASSDEKVAANVLERMLKEGDTDSRKPWRVYNLSMMAATTQTEVLNFLFWGLRLRPTYVISVTGYNDLHVPNLYFDAHNGLFIDPQLKKANEFYTRHSVKSGDFLHECGQFLRGTSRLFNAVIGKIERHQHQKNSDSVLTTFDQRVRATVNNLLLLNDMSHAAGAQYLAVFQPVGYGKKNLSSAEQENQNYFLTRHLNWKVFEDIKIYQKDHGGIYRMIVQQMQQVRPGFRFLDLEHLFDDEPSARFTDGITHLNDEGNHELAQAIYAQVSREIARGPQLRERVQL
jgi:hypothetical protein